jgi:hypothetical protein
MRSARRRKGCGRPLIAKKAVDSLKASSLASIILSLIFIPVNYIVHNYFAEEITLAIGEQFYYTWGFAIQSSAQTFIFLLILSLTYCHYIHKIPFQNPFLKALPFGALAYFITFVLMLLIDYPISPGLFYTNLAGSFAGLVLLYPFLLSSFARAFMLTR